MKTHYKLISIFDSHNGCFGNVYITGNVNWNSINIFFKNLNINAGSYSVDFDAHLQSWSQDTSLSKAPESV